MILMEVEGISEGEENKKEKKIVFECLVLKVLRRTIELPQQTMAGGTFIPKTAKCLKP